MGGSLSRAEDVGTGLIVVAASLTTIGVVMLASTGATLDQSLVERLSLETLFGRQVALAVGSCLVMVDRRNAKEPLAS